MTESTGDGPVVPSSAPAAPGDWSAAPKAEDLVAPWHGREAAGGRDATVADPLVAELAQVRTHGRGRRVLARILASAPVLILAAYAVNRFWYRAFHPYDPRRDLYPLFYGLLVVVPFLVYCLRSQFVTLRLLAVGAGFLTSLGGALLILAAGLVELADHTRFPLENLLVILLIFLLAGLTVAAWVWLFELEYGRLPPRRLSDGRLCFPSEPRREPVEAGSAVALEERGPKPLNLRQQTLYRLIAPSGIVAGATWFIVTALFDGSYRWLSAAPLLGLALLTLVSAVFVLAPWRKNRRWRLLALSGCVWAGVALAVALSVNLIFQRENNFYSYGYYNYPPLCPITFGYFDPELTRWTVVVIVLMFGCLVSALASLRLLRHELAAARRELPPLPPLPAPEAAFHRRDEEISVAPQWDERKPGATAARAPE